MRPIDQASNPARSSGRRRRGTAVALAIVFATILLLMAIGFSRILQHAQPQNRLIDERAKIEFLANSVIDKALLKFKLYPADFYAAVDAAKYNYPGPLQDFCINDPQLQMNGFAEASSSFAAFGVNVAIASVSLLTDWRWNADALRIEARAWFTDQAGKNVDKDVVRIVKLERRVNAP